MSDNSKIGVAKFIARRGVIIDFVYCELVNPETIFPTKVKD